MGENYTEASFALVGKEDDTAVFPKGFFTDEEKRILTEEHGVVFLEEGNGFRLASAYIVFTYYGEDERDHEIEEILQLALRRNKEFLAICAEFAHSSDEFDGEVGGSAYFITPDNFKFIGTSTWISEQIQMLRPERKEQDGPSS